MAQAPRRQLAKVGGNLSINLVMSLVLGEPARLKSSINGSIPAARATKSAFAEPSDGLEPSTPSLPWKAELACGVVSSGGA
jgi:hypothetical protein